jgi:hypothetical protein
MSGPFARSNLRGCAAGGGAVRQRIRPNTATKCAPSCSRLLRKSAFDQGSASSPRRPTRACGRWQRQRCGSRCRRSPFEPRPAQFECSPISRQSGGGEWIRPRRPRFGADRWAVGLSGPVARDRAYLLPLLALQRPGVDLFKEHPGAGGRSHPQTPLERQNPIRARGRPNSGQYRDVSRSPRDPTRPAAALSASRRC